MNAPGYTVLSPSIPAQRGQGALIFVKGISGVSIAGSTTGDLVPFRWPRWLKIVRQIMFTRAATRAELAGISLRIYDEKSDLVTDGQNVSPLAPFANALPWAGALGAGAMMTLSGWDWYLQPRQFTRIVRPNERWNFQVRNDNVGAAVPILAYEVEQLVGPPPTWTQGHKVLR